MACPMEKEEKYFMEKEDVWIKLEDEQNASLSILPFQNSKKRIWLSVGWLIE